MSDYRLTLSIRETAKALGICVRGTNELVLTRQLPSVKIGHRRVVTLKDIEEFLEKHKEHALDNQTRASQILEREKRKDNNGVAKNAK